MRAAANASRRFLAVATGCLTLCVDSALAHAGSFGAVSRTASVPSWLVVAAGAGLVGASFLFTSLLTDRTLIEGVSRRRRTLRVIAPLDRIIPIALTIVRWAAVAALVLLVAVGVVGPATASANALTLGVWIVWWAGYTSTTYLLGNTWPALNPWRTLASLGRSERRSLPPWLGSWPSVVGLLGLVALEVLSPLAADPRLLAVAIAGYSLVTVPGAIVFGDAWFDRVDPIARTFRLYGRLAPVQRSDQGVTLVLPGAALARDAEVADTADVAFVVALVWATTFDGLVSTSAWQQIVTATPGNGGLAGPLTLAALVAGFACFVGGYRLAARAVRRTAPTYVTARYLAGWFTPALVPIAAGYHFAHFAGYLVGYVPTAVAVFANPLGPPASLTVLSLPGWFGAVQVVAVVVGHVVAIWIAHVRAFGLFAGRVQPVRSQYPVAAVAICYTVTSLWIVAQPTAAGIS